MTRTNLAYHFTNDTLRDGSPLPPVGEWLEHKGDVVLCESGLHFSRHPFDALNYAPGNLLHLVEVDDIVEEDASKGVCRRRKIVATIDAEQLLRDCARKWALDVIDNWNAPTVVVQWLKTGDESLRSAAYSAADSAARAAADSAAASAAAYSAAWTAAWAAARAAAKAAADSAAYSAADSAAWTAAWAAARAAAYSAAYSAADSAAWTAARAAVRESQRKHFAEKVNEAQGEQQ